MLFNHFEKLATSEEFDRFPTELHGHVGWTAVDGCTFPFNLFEYQSKVQIGSHTSIFIQFYLSIWLIDYRTRFLMIWEEGKSSGGSP